MTEQPVEPVWLFEHSDRAGNTFAVADGWVRMTSPDGQSVTMALTGEQAWPLKPQDAAGAISLAMGQEIASVPTVREGVLVEWEPTRIRVGPDRYTPGQALRLAGQLGAALLDVTFASRQEDSAAVLELAATIAGRPWEEVPPGQRPGWVNAARRVRATFTQG